MENGDYPQEVILWHFMQYACLMEYIIIGTDTILFHTLILAEPCMHASRYANAPKQYPCNNLELKVGPKI